ncbi:MAG: hypothetical protein ABEJ66_01165, partial [Candidatus Nanohaloarchaea archaeon]
QALESNFSSAKGDLSNKLEQRVTPELSSFRQKVQEAEQAKKAGNYYRVSSILKGIESEYQAAQQSLQKVEKLDDSRDTRRLLLFVGGGFLLLLVAGLAVVYWSEELGIEEHLEGIGIDTGFLQEARVKVENLLEGQSEEEAETFEWDGFKD